MFKIVRIGRVNPFLQPKSLIRNSARDHLNFGTWWNGDAGWYRRIRGQGNFYSSNVRYKIEQIYNRSQVFLTLEIFMDFK